MRIDKITLIMFVGMFLPIGIMISIVVSEQSLWRIIALVIMISMQITSFIGILLDAKVKGNTDEEILGRWRKTTLLIFIPTFVTILTIVVVWIILFVAY